MNRYNTVGKRFWAGVVDGLIFLPIGFLELWIFSIGTSKMLLIMWLLVSYPAGWLYTVIMHGIYGQTVGKMVTGVKVLDVSEDRQITMRQSFLRESVVIIFNTVLLAYAIYFTLNDVPRDGNELANIDTVVIIGANVWFFAEIISCLSNYKRRAIHDYIAGTVVVRSDT